MSRPLSLPDRTALKTAIHDLVKACSGLDRAAAITGIGKSSLARAYADRDEKNPAELSWTTLDLVSVALLEADLAERGDPRRPVTECLARLTGRTLRDDVAVASRSSVALAATALMAAFGELSTDLVASLGDGVVTPTEGATGDAKAARVQSVLIELRTALAAAKAGEEQ